MRTLYIFVILITLITYSLIPQSAAEEIKEKLPFEAGERLIYDVYCDKIKIGKSVLTFHGEEKLDRKDLYHITFTTKLLGFKDIEDIYAYKGTFLPFKVTRLIKEMGGLTTRIREEYDQDAFKVEIKNRRIFLSKKYTIEKERPIYNSILLTYYYRIKPAILKRDRFKVTFPTADFDVVFKGKETITTPLGRYTTYVFTSIPSRFTFWLSADEKRIPLKIKDRTILDHTFIINSIKNTKQ